jgi:drug/metabolite transporter (DMT)-like permease
LARLERVPNCHVGGLSPDTAESAAAALLRERLAGRVRRPPYPIWYQQSVTRRGWFLFVSMCVIWGVPYLFIRIAVRELSPATLVFARTALSALLLLPLAARHDALRPLLRHWRPLLLFAAIEIAAPWWLLSHAEETLSSSMTALLIAGVPLIGAVVALTSGKRERLGGPATAGLLIGIAGVAVLVGFDTGGAGIAPMAEVGLVAVCYAVGPAILDRSLAHLPALGVIAASLGLCTVAYAPVAAAQLPASMPSGEVLASVAVLAFLCTALAFVLFFELIATVGPVRGMVTTYVNPAVAALLGVAFLDERFTPGMGLGLVLILAGSILAARKPGKAARSEPADGLPVPVPASDC